MTKHDLNLSRRGFVQGGAGLTFSFAVGGFLSARPEEVMAAAGNTPQTIGGWVTISPDGSIVIQAPAAEMGQGVMTGIPMIIAEELDADWSKVTAQFAPATDPKTFGNPKLGGILHTVASKTTEGYWDKARIAGAQARQVLMQAAAEKWGVPLSEVSTQPSMVVHTGTGRKMSYGEIAGFAKMPAQLPVVNAGDLKKPDQYRIIGQSAPRLDIPEKTNGTAMYGLDVQVPGMVYATLHRCPIEGGEVDKIDATAVLKIPGALQTVRMKDAVGFVGASVEAVFAMRDAVKVTWKGGQIAGFDSVKGLDEYSARARDNAEKGLAYHPKGDADAAMAKAAKVIKADYQADYVYHAQMEPMNITAHVNAAGDGAEIWGGTQTPSITVNVAAAVLKTKPDKIKFHQYYLGGGYGRRAMVDLVPYALQLSKETKKPVKLIWTREQDVKAAKMRPMTAHHLEAGLDADGNIVAWKHKLVGEAVTGYLAPARLEAAKGLDPLTLEGAEHQYEIENRVVEYVREKRGAALAAWRSIGAGYNKFVIEAFMDEIAADQKADPVAFRLKFLKNDPRATKVIEECVKLADWGGKVPEGRARGFSFAYVVGTPSAAVIEISLDRKSGAIRAHRFWSTVDPGIVINPDIIVSQTESNVIYGLSQMLKERITLAKGEVEQSNFNDYEILRLSETPEIVTKIVPSTNRPTGIGEVALPLIGGAVSNALFAMTGKRLRHMPFTPERVKAALA